MTDGNRHLDRLLPADPAATARLEPPRPVAAAAVPERLPAHLARKLQEPASDRSRQLAGLVAAAVEWGLNDGQVLALALAHRPTRERQQTKGTNVQADVARLLAKLRPTHAHVGHACDAAGCPNAPSWMRTETQPANGQSPTRPPLPPPAVAAAGSTAMHPNGHPLERQRRVGLARSPTCWSYWPATSTWTTPAMSGSPWRWRPRPRWTATRCGAC